MSITDSLSCGVILAGGTGSRLHPITLSVSKQLLPIYDKPMIFYPMSILMLAGVRDVLIISTPIDLPAYQRLFGDGGHLGLSISYAVQQQPKGIAQAFTIGEKFIKNRPVCLALGDNIFYGPGLSPILQRSLERQIGAGIMAYQVRDPQRFGVVEFDDSMKVISIEEKPENPKSDYAVTGLYFYDSDVVEIAKTIQPSQRGELEITAVNEVYMREDKLHVELLGRGYAWLDTGTIGSLLEASQFIETIEARQGLKVACLEEIALGKGWVSAEEIINKVGRYSDSNYGRYVNSLLDGR